MTRFTLATAIITLTLAGCAAGNPMAAAPSAPAFTTKLLNLASIGSQAASQVNYIPNMQENLSGQTVMSNVSAMFPIASAVGTGAAAAANAVTQSITNETSQDQEQSQLVL